MYSIWFYCVFFFIFGLFITDQCLGGFSGRCPRLLGRPAGRPCTHLSTRQWAGPTTGGWHVCRCFGPVRVLFGIRLGLLIFTVNTWLFVSSIHVTAMTTVFAHCHLHLVNPMFSELMSIHLGTGLSLIGFRTHRWKFESVTVFTHNQSNIQHSLWKINIRDLHDCEVHNS